MLQCLMHNVVMMRNEVSMRWLALEIHNGFGRTM
uniref:Uncharacterized protein n=1 Tax=Arundo donax TaxID=35708 RepID=A0A0A9ENN1_ARUDO